MGTAPRLGMLSAQQRFRRISKNVPLEPERIAEECSSDLTVEPPCPDEEDRVFDAGRSFCIRQAALGLRVLSQESGEILDDEAALPRLMHTCHHDFEGVSLSLRKRGEELRRVTIERGEL